MRIFANVACMKSVCEIQRETETHSDTEIGYLDTGVVYICMREDMYVCMNICIYMYIYTHARNLKRKRTHCTYTDIYLWRLCYITTCTRTHAHTHTHTHFMLVIITFIYTLYIYILLYIYMYSVYVYSIYIYIYTHTI